MPGFVGSARRLAEEFSLALESRSTHALPALAAPLAPLGRLASELQAAPLGPREDFRESLRQRLVAVAAVSTAAPAVDPLERLRDWADTWRVQRGMRVATAGVATVVAISGIGIAGSRSLPGDPFYGVKRGTEALQLRLASSDAAKGRRQLEFAATRLHEVARLAGVTTLPGAGSGVTAAEALGGPLDQRVNSALSDMDAETTDGARLLTSAYIYHQDKSALETLAGFATTQQARLRALIPDLPAGSELRAYDSLDLISRVNDRTTVLLGTAPMALPEPLVTPPSATPTAAPTPSPTDQLPAYPPVEQPPTTEPSGPEPSEPPTPSPTPTDTQSPTPTPTPTPSPSGIPLPVPPLPVPLPVPIPTTLPPLPLPIPVPIPTTLPPIPTITPPAPE